MVEVLHAVTSVRAVLVNGLSSGLRNDAPDRAIAMRQKCVGVVWRSSVAQCNLCCAALCRCCPSLHCCQALPMTFCASLFSLLRPPTL